MKMVVYIGACHRCWSLFQYTSNISQRYRVLREEVGRLRACLLVGLDEGISVHDIHIVEECEL